MILNLHTVRRRILLIYQDIKYRNWESIPWVKDMKCMLLIAWETVPEMSICVAPTLT